MIVRILLAAAIVVAGAGLASAQTVLDASDPAITRRPQPDYGMRVPKYPDQSFKRNEQGDVSLTVCIDQNGAFVSGDLWKSSGYQELDEATLKWMRGGPRWRPAMIGDNPVAICNYNFSYTWKLRERPGNPIDPTKSYVDWTGLNREDRPSIAAQVDGPVYPKSAEAKGLGGPMSVSLCISPFGKMVSAKLVEGVNDADLMLAMSVWLGRFTFNPGKRDGAPVGVCGFPVKYIW